MSSRFAGLLWALAAISLLGIPLALVEGAYRDVQYRAVRATAVLERFEVIPESERVPVANPPAYQVENDDVWGRSCCWAERHFRAGGAGAHGRGFRWGALKGAWVVVYVGPIGYLPSQMERQGWGVNQAEFLTELRRVIGPMGAKLVLYQINDYSEFNVDVLLGYRKRAYDVHLVNAWAQAGSGSERIFQQMLWASENLFGEKEYVANLIANYSHRQVIEWLKNKTWPKYAILDPKGRLAAYSNELFLNRDVFSVSLALARAQGEPTEVAKLAELRTLMDWMEGPRK